MRTKAFYKTGLDMRTGLLAAASASAYNLH